MLETHVQMGDKRDLTRTKAMSEESHFSVRVPCPSFWNAKPLPRLNDFAGNHPTHRQDVRAVSVVSATDRLASYRATLRTLGIARRQAVARNTYKRAAHNHLPFRRRKRSMFGFGSMKTLQKFTAVQYANQSLQP